MPFAKVDWQVFKMLSCDEESQIYQGEVRFIKVVKWHAQASFVISKTPLLSKFFYPTLKNLTPFNRQPTVIKE